VRVATENAHLATLVYTDLNGNAHNMTLVLIKIFNNQVKSSQIAFNKTSDNCTSVKIDINENKKQ